nr:unnamed protein product [Haemonchus contortus]
MSSRINNWTGAENLFKLAVYQKVHFRSSSLALPIDFSAQECVHQECILQQRNRMESFLRRLAVFGLLSSYIHAQDYSDDDYDIYSDEYPFHQSYPHSIDRPSRPYPSHNRRDHHEFGTSNRGSRDCHNCKEIGNACSTSAPDDQVICAKPKIV